MIDNLSKLVTDGLFEPVTLLNTTKSNNPIVGEIYHDINKKINYFFDGTNWKELVISSKDVEFNKKRMRKIKRLFK